MDYEELNEIRKMTRRGFAEATDAEEEHAATTTETAAQAAERILSEAAKLGYSVDDIALLPDGVTVDAGCGNPNAVAGIKYGESVLVVGYRTGADIFLAGQAAGPKGQVIGVEESSEAVTELRAAAREAGLAAVEIRVGEDENLPVADKSFDAALTNCAVTFSFDKARVLREIYRVLKPGGRLILCEPCLRREAPKDAVNAVRQGTECLEGGFYAEDYLRALKKAGFKKSKIIDETGLPQTRLRADVKAAALLTAGDIDDKLLEIMTRSVKVIKVLANRA
jgi:arsenite methyltransferase